MTGEEMERAIQLLIERRAKIETDLERQKRLKRALPRRSKRWLKEYRDIRR